MAKQIKISEILEDLNNGVTRVQIGVKYEISAREVKALFEHPSLKGKKAKKGVALSFTIVDDTRATETSVDNTQEAVVEEVATPTPVAVESDDQEFE